MRQLIYLEDPAGAPAPSACIKFSADGLLGGLGGDDNADGPKRSGEIPLPEGENGGLP